jgi:hypothetical protein
VRAPVVRTTMRHRVGHPVEDLWRDDWTGVSPQLNDSADTAHGSPNAIAERFPGRRPFGQRLGRRP